LHKVSIYSGSHQCSLFFTFLSFSLRPSSCTLNVFFLPIACRLILIIPSGFLIYYIQALAHAAALIAYWLILDDENDQVCKLELDVYDGTNRNACDCPKCDAVRLVNRIVLSCQDFFTANSLDVWIINNGGWVSIIPRYRSSLLLFRSQFQLTQFHWLTEARDLGVLVLARELCNPILFQ